LLRLRWRKRIERGTQRLAKEALMIWTLKIECLWGWHLEDDCVRVVEIDAKSTLYDLHEAIQDAVHFDRDHPFEFYAGRNRKNRKLLFDETSPRKGSWNAYSGTTLDQVYPLPKGLRLFYHFDFGDNWYFAISRSRKKPSEPQAGIDYPRVVERIGPNPFQYGPPLEE
jgi:hypothetical protein